MALTFTDVACPMGAITEFPLGQFKARVIDVTLDSSYLTTGEVLTAAALGWDYIYGVLELETFSNSTGTLGLPSIREQGSAGSQLTFQPLESAADGDPMDEGGSTNDFSAFTGRFIVLGY
ncbi:MAG: hypothetical protein OJJ55_06655 [Rhodococcus sp.]|nr:hypothetical protein [Rhodococcus sp. (in: high G+C Gram-positive bacteria)]